MVAAAQEVLDALVGEQTVSARDFERLVETDNLLGAPLDEGQLPTTYPGSARSTSVSNLRDVDHERLPSVGSLNPFSGSAIGSTKTGGRRRKKGTESAAHSPDTGKSDRTGENTVRTFDHDNPLLTLANSVPMNSSGSSKDDSGSAESGNHREWIEHSSSVSNNQLLAMQVLAQSIAQESSAATTATIDLKSSSGVEVPPDQNLSLATGTPNSDTMETSNGIDLDKGQGEENKLFVCDHPACGKTFSRKMNLMSHYQSAHEHKKPFACAKCSKSFSRHSDRRRHEKSQHSETTTFTCGGLLDSGAHWGCGKVFKRKDGLTAHWKSGKARKKCFKGLNAESHRRVEGDLAKS